MEPEAAGARVLDRHVREDRHVGRHHRPVVLDRSILDERLNVAVTGVRRVVADDLRGDRGVDVEEPRLDGVADDLVERGGAERGHPRSCTWGIGAVRGLNTLCGGRCTCRPADRAEDTLAGRSRAVDHRRDDCGA